MRHLSSLKIWRPVARLATLGGVLGLTVFLAAASGCSGSDEPDGTGGMTGTGGSNTGGNNTGGSGTGGSATGGTRTGGTGTGGAATGGAATGGTTTGGAAGGAASAGHAGGGAGGRAGASTGGLGGGGGTPTGGAGSGGSGGQAPGAYNPCPTDGTACKLLPLGDSITYGLITVANDKKSSDKSIDGKDSHGGYRVKVFASAVAAQQKITFTGGVANGPDMVAGVAFPKSHSGYSGYTIDNSTGSGINTTTVLDPAFKTIPDIILLHIGTNDVYSSKGMQAGMADRLTKLLDGLSKRAPKALIVVATIIPLSGAATSSNNMTIKTYNTAIPEKVAAQVAAGHHVVMVDIFNGFDGAKLLSGDGVHPNQAGYDFMGDKFYGAIAGLLPK